MVDDNLDGEPEHDLAAGDFSSWMAEVEPAIGGVGGVDVPCNGCTACCRSFQFVHIAAEETDTLSHIPAELLAPAPGMPRGHVVLGYDDRGHCPMLKNDRCSIYEHRPRTCRTYDCRVFPAAGVEIDDDDKVLIARRARRWRFNFPTQADRSEHEAVRAAATFIRENAGLLPDAALATNTTQLAVLAIEVHSSFLGRDARTGRVSVVDPDPEAVGAELRSRIGAGGRA